jgi:hypothetical protein
MDRIIITKPFLGIFNMQVCAVNDATEEEIIAFANDTNPSGTTLGWTHISYGSKQEPVKCADDPNRIHYILVC